MTNSAQDQTKGGITRVQLDRQTGIRPWQHLPLFLLACAVLISRRPDAILHARFYAEDGHVWFADAYNLGWWGALFRAQDGYFQTFPRLAGALALLVPLTLAPLVLNLAALAVQALPVNLLLWSRGSAWGSLRFRFLLAAVYLALPNTREMILVVTSSQWVLALCAFLVLASSPPVSVAGRIFDVSVLLLCGLTGPFCFFLLPIALFVAWKRGERRHWALAGALGAASLVQLWALLILDRSGRSPAELGASPALFTRIIGGHVYFGALLGSNGLAAGAGSAVFITLLAIAIGGTVLVLICFVRSALEMRLFLLLTAMLLTASLISPAAYPPPGVSKWELLEMVPGGIRYWFFPSLAFAWSLLVGIRSRGELFKGASAVLLCMMCFGIVHDWRIPPMKDLHWAEDAKRFEAAPAGTVVVLPENPPGWNLRLVKHSSN